MKCFVCEDRHAMDGRSLRADSFPPAIDTGSNLEEPIYLKEGIWWMTSKEGCPNRFFALGGLAVSRSK